MALREKIAEGLRKAAALVRREPEIGVAFADSDLAKWGVKPYLSDDLLKSRAQRLLVYREMLRDPAVKAGYLGRVFKVLATDWDLRPAGYDARRRPEADDPNVEATDFLRHVLAGLPGPGVLQLFWDLSQALVDGFAVVEKVLAPIEKGRWAGKVGLAALKAKDADGWDFEVDEFLNVTALKQQVKGVWHERDRSRFVVFSWLSRFANPLGQSEFRAAYRAFWLKDSSWKFRAMYLEALAKGRRKVTYPAEQGEAGRKAAETLLRRLQESLGFAIPSDLAVELVEAATAPAAVFREMIGDSDKEIVLGLTGATLQVLEGQDTGALRATETHRKTAEPWAWVLGQWIAAAVQSDLVRPLWEINFALDEPPTFYWRWPKEITPEEVQALEGLQRMGLKIPAWYAQEQFGVPAAEEDDEVLEPSPGPRGPGLWGAPAAALAGESDPREELERRALDRAPAASRALAEAIIGRLKKNAPSPRSARNLSGSGTR